MDRRIDGSAGGLQAARRAALKSPFQLHSQPVKGQHETTLTNALQISFVRGPLQEKQNDKKNCN